MTVLIIFPVILQTVIDLIMLSIGGQGHLQSRTHNYHRRHGSTEQWISSCHLLSTDKYHQNHGNIQQYNSRVWNSIIYSSVINTFKQQTEICKFLIEDITDVQNFNFPQIRPKWKNSYPKSSIFGKKCSDIRIKFSNKLKFRRDTIATMSLSVGNLTFLQI